MRLKNRVALVTGGVTGIGKAIALTFGRQGAALALNYSKSEADAQSALSELMAIDVPTMLIKADVTQDEQVRAAVDQTIRQFGRIDILVNGAGVTRPVQLVDLDGLTEDIWDLTYAVNVKGAFFCSRAVASQMRCQGEGCIVNIASAAGINGQGSSIAYAASKAALISLTKSLALALAPDIRVNAVAPGFVPTRWNAGHENWHVGIIRDTPLKRLAQPEDIARLVLALATDASFVTGQTIACDGGITR